MTTVEIVFAGLGVGGLFGAFGAGGSAFATPVLALLGVPGAMAVASPLPAMVPAALAGARRYLRAGQLDARTARLAIARGLPGTVLGGLLSDVLGGTRLLVLSGVMLALVGLRVLVPDSPAHVARAGRRRGHRGVVLGAAFAVGLLTGVLANGGGFLLVPLFMVVLGLPAARAAGTSLVATAALSVPTLLVHAALGHVDWSVAAAFGAGLVPGTAAGARLGTGLPGGAARRAFGALLVVFAAAFLVHLAF